MSLTGEQQAALYFGRKRRRAHARLTPVMELTNKTVAEGAAVEHEIAALSVRYGSGDYVFTLTGDADGQFVLDGAVLEVADTLTPGKHVVTVEADNGEDPVVEGAFLITVTPDEA